MARRKLRKNTIKRICARDGWRCHYCNLTVQQDLPQMHPRKSTVDHKVPLVRGGASNDSNLVCACARCNGIKGNMPYDAYLWYRHMLVRGEKPMDLLVAIESVFGNGSSWLGYYEDIPAEAWEEVRDG